MSQDTLIDLLIREVSIGIRRMVEHSECSHSFNLVSASGKVITVLIVATPARLDYPIYQALKPIIEADGKVGTLVEPNPRVPRD